MAMAMETAATMIGIKAATTVPNTSRRMSSAIGMAMDSPVSAASCPTS